MRPFIPKASTTSLPPLPLRLLPGGANQFPGGICTCGSPVPFTAHFHDTYLRRPHFTLEMKRAVQLYCSRSTFAGSTRSARRTGPATANKPLRSVVSATAERTTGSCAVA